MERPHKHFDCPYHLIRKCDCEMGEANLATNYDAWMEYIDPDGIMKEDEFQTLTVAEKIELIREVA